MWRCYSVMTSLGGYLGEGGNRTWLMWVLLAGWILLRKEPTTERYESLPSLRLSSVGEGVTWKHFRCLFILTYRCPPAVVTDTKCPQLKPTSATLSRTMLDNTCLPGEPKILFVVNILFDTTNSAIFISEFHYMFIPSPFLGHLAG